MPAPESSTSTKTWDGRVEGADAEGGVGDAVHGVLGVEQQVEDDLLQLALVALDGCERGGEVRFDADARGFELVIEQDERSRAGAG